MFKKKRKLKVGDTHSAYIKVCRNSWIGNKNNKYQKRIVSKREILIVVNVLYSDERMISQK